MLMVQKHYCVINMDQCVYVAIWSRDRPRQGPSSYYWALLKVLLKETHNHNSNMAVPLLLIHKCNKYSAN